MIRKSNTLCICACLLSLAATAALADAPPLDEAAYEAAKGKLQQQFEAKEEKADRAYADARKLCKPLKGDARKACRDKADHDHEAAIRLAKVEKVEAQNALKSRLVVRQALVRPRS